MQSCLIRWSFLLTWAILIPNGFGSDQGYSTTVDVAAQLKIIQANLSSVWETIHEQHDHHKKRSGHHSHMTRKTGENEAHIYIHMHVEDEEDDGPQHHHGHHDQSTSMPPTEPLAAHCEMIPNSRMPDTIKHKVKGSVHITQKNYSAPVVFDIHLTGFDVGENHKNHNHGFHIHEFGSLHKSCEGLGTHFDISNSQHGALTAKSKDSGDLGNIRHDAKGEVNTLITADYITLVGKNGIGGRSIVIHNNAGNGGEGTKIACCVIGRANPKDTAWHKSHDKASTTHDHH